ncbi:hypothetical protein LINPERPRIM_LOCUS17699 [Linum perenne]
MNTGAGSSKPPNVEGHSSTRHPRVCEVEISLQVETTLQYLGHH